MAAAKAKGATPGRGGGGNGNGLLPPELRGGYFMPDGRGSGQDMRGLRGPNAPERPAAANRPNFPRVEPDPNMTLDYAFKVMLFWIVSRSNNCVYCTGHQENKLTAAGVTEDRIAALDGDWSEFTHAERAAFALTRKLTVAPQTITDADIDAAKKHFTNLQVLEIITTVAGFNGMNRWTGPLRLTQQEFRVFLTPTSPKYEAVVTKLGPVAAGEHRSPLRAGGRASAGAGAAIRGRGEVGRVPRAGSSVRPGRRIGRPGAVAGRLVPGRQTAAELGPPPGQLPQERPGEDRQPAGLAHQGEPTAQAEGGARLGLGPSRPGLVRLGLRPRRLRALDIADDTIFAIDQGTDSKFTPAERAAFAFARKLTVDPALIDDDDFDGLKKYYSDTEIAELIHHVNQAVFFNLVTEAAGLPLDGGSSKVVSQR